MICRLVRWRWVVPPTRTMTVSRALCVYRVPFRVPCRTRYLRTQIPEIHGESCTALLVPGFACRYSIAKGQRYKYPVSLCPDQAAGSSQLFFKPNLEGSSCRLVAGYAQDSNPKGVRSLQVPLQFSISATEWRSSKPFFTRGFV